MGQYVPPRTGPINAPAPRAAATTTPQGETCRIVDVVDGDTIRVRCGNLGGNIRLMGYDTPETFRPGCALEKALGERAKSYLRRRIAQARVIHPTLHGTDKYRRLLGRLYLDGRDAADIMVEAGLAVRYHGERRINWCERLNAQL